MVILLDRSTSGFVLTLILPFWSEIASVIVTEWYSYSSLVRYTLTPARRIPIKLPKISCVNFFEMVKCSVKILVDQQTGASRSF